MALTQNLQRELKLREQAFELQAQLSELDTSEDDSDIRNAMAVEPAEEEIVALQRLKTLRSLERGLKEVFYKRGVVDGLQEKHESQ